MGTSKSRSGDRHIGAAKTIRFSAQQAARLDAARARMGGTYADVIDAALRLWEGQSHPSNAELIAMLEARLNGKG